MIEKKRDSNGVLETLNTTTEGLLRKGRHVHGPNMIDDVASKHYQAEELPASQTTEFIPCVLTDEKTGLSYIDAGDFTLHGCAWGEKGVRKFMEDTHVMCFSLSRFVNAKRSFPSRLDGAVFAIFDGHGGRQTSSFCRDQLVPEMTSEAVRLFGVEADDKFCYTDSRVRRLFCETFKKLDRRIASELPGCRDGSTAILAFFPFYQPFPGNELFIACLGDAAACLSRSDNGTFHAIPLSDVHKPWMIKEKERILKMGGTVESGRVNGLLEVSRSLGDISLKKYGLSCKPDFMKFRIHPQKDEFVLLGCDGFWLNWTCVEAANKTRDILVKEERRQLVSQGAPLASHSEASIVTPDLKSVCQKLVEHVLVDKKSQDNVSTILLRIQKKLQN